MIRVLWIIKTILVSIGWPVLKIIKLVTPGRISVIVFIGLLFWGGSWFYTQILSDLPSVDQINNPPKLSTKILDRNGKLLYKFYDDENRSWTPINKIPQSLQLATIAIEDKDFYKHHGISLRGMLTAIIYNFKKNDDEKLRGGSTISQQLVKNVFLTNEKSWKRKIKEVILTLMVEKTLSKQEILERYFNQVGYGGEIYGVQEAAYRYFGKNVWEINLAEATFLAGLPAAPTSYSPFGANPELADARQKHVIDQMAAAGFISQEKATDLKSTKIELIKEKKDIEAPHFVFYVRDMLQQKYGFYDIGRLGLTIKTTLDYRWQQLAEKVVKEEVDKVGGLRISNGAALIVGVKTGDILAMVGSRDYYSKVIDGKYNVTTALRQPGSSIKPINYLLALKNGKSMMTTIDDSPVTYPSQWGPAYTPQNYNGKFMGRVTLKTALASSLNVPSVKLLAENGVDNMIDLAESMGITTWKDRSRFGLALALGAGEVKMTEMAQAYSIFAAEGKKVEINPIVSVDNYLGENLFSKEVEVTNLVEPGYAFLINNALSDNDARTPIFGANSKLKINGKTVAVKTGTTNNLKDNWCLGWTPSYLVTAWVGNNDSSPMSWVASGISGATPIWSRIMTEILADKPDEKWEVPMGVYKATVCGKEDYFVKNTEASVRCITPVLPSVTPGN